MKVGIELLQKKQNSGDTQDLTTAIYVLKALIFFGENLRLIVLTSTGISAALAAYDFMTGNMGWGTVDAVFAFGGIILLVQLKDNR